MSGKFIMLCGLPASGKSEYAQKLKQENVEIEVLSSDEIREKVFGDVQNQDHNKEVFEIMRNNAISFVKEGKTVVYDATNISRKRRMGMLSQLPKGVAKEVHFCYADLDLTLYRNRERNRMVPESVIRRMSRGFQIPVKGEGWDEVKYIYTQNKVVDNSAHAMKVLEGRFTDHDSLMSSLAEIYPEFRDIFNLPQDSKYHSLSVSRHAYHVYEGVRSHAELGDDTALILASLLHDIGKGRTKDFHDSKGNPSRYAHFYGHEYTGSLMAIMILREMRVPQKMLEEIVTLIQFHMHMYQDTTSTTKLAHLLGAQMYIKLVALNMADRSAK